MRRLPLADPGIPVHRSPAGYLRWVGRMQLRSIGGAMCFGVLWMVAQALMPAAIGQAIDAGLGHRDTTALFDWAAVLFGLGVVQAVAGLCRHRFSTANFLIAAYRTVQVVARHSARLGATLPKRVATGEVVSVGSTDISQIGGLADVLGRFAGAVVSFVTVAVILLLTSAPLGLLVLIGVPVLVLAIGPMLKPLHARQQAQRTLGGELASYANDIVNGLRVLRGVGGEDIFAERYRQRSQRVKDAGYRVAGVESLLDATQILLPGIFIVLVTWLGARFALEGVISAGQLVAFYGYAAFLVQPLSTGTEAADKLTRGLVAARRVVRILDMTPDITDPPAPPASVPDGPRPVDLLDVTSGLSVPGGKLTVVVASGTLTAADLADRLGRYTEGDVLLRGVRLDQLPVAEVRRRILVSDTDARLFAGRLVEELLPDAADPATWPDLTSSAAPTRPSRTSTPPTTPLRRTDPGASDGRGGQDGDAAVGTRTAVLPYGGDTTPTGAAVAAEVRIRAALDAASALDILVGLPDGLATEVEERGRSFSGGQRQRLVLARALLADPDVLVLVEPTSAVDAHTEARIAERLTGYRAGRTTVVFTISPLLADQADRVVFLVDGRVAAEGRHADLLARDPAYRSVVLRGEEDAAVTT